MHQHEKYLLGQADEAFRVGNRDECIRLISALYAYLTPDDRTRSIQDEALDGAHIAAD